MTGVTVFLILHIIVYPEIGREAEDMRRKKSWKMCLNELFFCKPKLNRRLLCIRGSMNDVCDILNSWDRCGDHRKGRKRR